MTSQIHDLARPGFQGLTVLSFESRMAAGITRLIERYGGRPLVAPALREIPLHDNAAVLEFGHRLTAGQIDVLILLTGVGTTALFDLLNTRYPLPSILEALKQTTLVVRGPKPAAVLSGLGLSSTVTVPEPNTWVDVVHALDAQGPMKGFRIAVQEYGVSNPELLEALAQRGADVFPVPIYKWALPEDLGPLECALNDVIAGKVNVALMTNAVQVEHVIRVLERNGAVEAFCMAMKKLVVASVGPTTSERLHQYGWPVDFEPSHSKMGVLVKETAERAWSLLKQKR